METFRLQLSKGHHVLVACCPLVLDEIKLGIHYAGGVALGVKR